MMHTIARYYNTMERMTGLFCKSTNQMITNCKEQIMNSSEYKNMWDQPVDVLLKNLDAALSLNDHYERAVLAVVRQPSADHDSRVAY
jgi:dynein heavy chain